MIFQKKIRAITTSTFTGLGLVLLLLFPFTTNLKAQVRIINGTAPILCSTNNGVTNKYQNAVIEVMGPEDQDWCFSYSLNNSPAQTANNGEAIKSARFELELNFRNETSNIANYQLCINEAWNSKGEPIEIQEDQNCINIQILPLPQPEIKEYHPKAWINSVVNYQTLIGKSSNFEIILPESALLSGVKTSLQDNRKLIDFTINWHEKLGPTYFKFIETNALSCSSDTLYAGIELTDHFSLENKNPVYLCEGSTLQLKPQPDLPGDYSFLWMDESTAPTKEVQQVGSYPVTVTEKSTGQSQQFTFKVEPATIPDFTIPPVLILEEETPIEITVPSAYTTCLWSTGSTSNVISIDTTGDFWLEASTNEGCSNSFPFKVILSKDAFKLSLPPQAHLCSGDILEIKPELSIDQAYQFQWSTGSTEPSIEVSSPGEYRLEVKDSNGLIRTATITVIDHPLPIVDLGEDFILWEGESSILDAKNPGASYQWNTGQTTQYIEVNSGGAYSVTVTDHYGCFAADEVIVDFRKGQRFAVDLGEDVSICDGDSILLIPTLEGNPTLPLSYSWTPGNLDREEIWVKKEGQYSLEVIDGNGNRENSTVQVKLLPSPMVDLGPDQNPFIGEEVELDAGNPNAYYQWSTGSISQKILVSQSGEYNVIVTNSHNCSSSDTLLIQFREELPIVEVPLAFSPNGDGKNDQLFIKGPNIKSIHFLIYNRLGQKLFESRNPDKGWNGYFRGELQNIDVYVYVLDITFTDGKTRRQKGNISLLR